MGNPIARRRRNILFAFFFIMGLALMFQIKSEKDRNVFLNRENLRAIELQLLLERSELERLSEYQLRRMGEMEELRTTKDDQNLEELLRRQKRNAMSLGGYATYRGPGLRITLEDSDAEILPSQNPNDFVVHDQDVLNIVNDLRTAGAEVVSINQQVLHAGSVIKCSGATITVDGRTFGQPFVIRVIGELEPLNAAVKAKESYAVMISTVYGIRVTVEEHEMMEILSARPTRNLDYIKEDEEL